MENNKLGNEKICNCLEYPAEWGEFGWICRKCGKESECSIRYTKEDMKPFLYEDGVIGKPNLCCPACPHEMNNKFAKQPAIELITTLSELFEKCGDRLVSITRLFNDYNQTVYWEVVGLGGKYPQVSAEIVKVRGVSPEEAVANLWRELNKKNGDNS